MSFWFPLQLAVAYLLSVLIFPIPLIVSLFFLWNWRLREAILAWMWKTWSVAVNRLIFGVRPVFENREILQENKRGAIVASNHQSLLDIPVLLEACPLTFIMKSSIFWYPVIGQACLISDTVGVSRGSTASRKRAVRKAIWTVKNRLSLILFPEGTRTKTGYLLPRFKKGLLVAAWKNDIPVVPTAIHGTFKVYNKNEFVIRRGHDVYVRAGEPVQPADYETGNAFSDAVRDAISRLFDALNEEYPHAARPAPGQKDWWQKPEETELEETNAVSESG